MHAKFDQLSKRERPIGRPKLDGKTILKFIQTRTVSIMDYIKGGKFLIIYVTVKLSKKNFIM
jgi:hypothetical protein